MSLIKDIYNRKFYESFAKEVQVVYPAFPAKQFLKNVLGNGFKSMEWKDRLLHTTHCFREGLPPSYPTALKVMLAIVAHLQKDSDKQRLEYMFFPQMIAVYGLENFDISIKAFEKVTQFISCEFAVRPFILLDSKKVLMLMRKFTQHKNEHVRRFASEGIRPRLPWGQAIPAFKADPSPLFPILELLMQDESIYVRKSVANHLNDISKDHPHLVIDFAKKWKGTSASSDWIIKHALRTLLKAGDPRVMEMYELKHQAFQCSKFTVKTKKVSIGNELEFSGGIQNCSDITQLVRLEYSIYFLRQDGKFSKKVFKISERAMAAGELLSIQKKHSFKLITTRKYYVGKHKIGFIVNGKEMELRDFLLVQE